MRKSRMRTQSSTNRNHGEWNHSGKKCHHRLKFFAEFAFLRRGHRRRVSSYFTIFNVMHNRNTASQEKKNRKTNISLKNYSFYRTKFAKNENFFHLKLSDRHATNIKHQNVKRGFNFFAVVTLLNRPQL
jgi:hypothetical protein